MDYKEGALRVLDYVEVRKAVGRMVKFKLKISIL